MEDRNTLNALIEQKSRIEAAIDAEHARLVQEGCERSVRENHSPKFNAMTPEQQQHCLFMGFDPDNPDVPLD